MNFTECRPQTDVSAPGAGTAAAKHHRDMMWLLWLDRPRLRDNGRPAAAGTTDFPTGSRSTKARIRLDPSRFGFAGHR
jgi:hypothetical protein